MWFLYDFFRKFSEVPLTLSFLNRQWQIEFFFKFGYSNFSVPLVFQQLPTQNLAVLFA